MRDLARVPREEYLTLERPYRLEWNLQLWRAMKARHRNGNSGIPSSLYTFLQCVESMRGLADPRRVRPARIAAYRVAGLYWGL